VKSAWEISRPIRFIAAAIPLWGDYMPLDDRNLRAIAEHYLITAIKLSAAEIELLKRKLAGNYRIIKGV